MKNENKLKKATDDDVPEKRKLCKVGGFEILGNKAGYSTCGGDGNELFYVSQVMQKTKRETTNL